MKIFILPTSYPDAEHPTKDIFIYEQAKALATLGHQVVVLHVNKLPSSKIFEHINKTIKVCDDGFAKRYTINIKTFKEDKLLAFNKIFFVSAMNILFDYAVEHDGKPDVLYAHFSCWAGYAAVKLSNKYNIPCAVLEHYSGLVRNGGKVSRKLKSCIIETVKGANKFICVSFGLKKAVLNLLGNEKNNIEVITNMINSRFVYSEPVDKPELVFSAIGRLSSPKKIEQLVEAFADAFDATDKVFLRIGGDGELREKIVQKIQEKKREHQILILGPLTREQTYEEYRNCDCFVLPSGWETFGLVYREAMAVGRPIITTNHGGFDENTWNDKCGYMVPVDDVGALTEALKEMRKNYKQFNGKAISQFCLSTCSYKIVSKKIEAALLSAIETRNQGLSR